MWRRLSSQIRFIRTAQKTNGITTSSPSPVILQPAAALISRHISTERGNVSKKRVEYMSIATGFTREELEAEIEAPAVVKSYYNQRSVGCAGVEGEKEDERYVVWLWLKKKSKPHECPVCSQYFVLEVVGPGGHADEGDHHH